MDLRRLFGPRRYRGGRVQVWGCSPGCIAVSLLLSCVLTLLLNLIFNFAGGGGAPTF